MQSFVKFLFCLCIIAYQLVFANIAEQKYYDTRISTIFSEEKIPLHVDREDLTFNCQGKPRVATCAYTASYEISNPTSTLVNFKAAFYSYNRKESVDIFIDGKKQTLAPGQKVRGKVGNPYAIRDFTVTVPAGQRVSVLAKGVTPLKCHGRRGSYGIMARKARHLALGSTPEHCRMTLVYALGAIKNFNKVGPILVKLKMPSWWSAPGLEREGWQKNEEGYERTISRNIPKSLIVRFKILSSRMGNGGVFLGFGSVEGFTMRFGYDLAYDNFYLLGVSLDTNYKNYNVAAATLKLASPHIFFIPSVSVGLGAVMAIEPEKRAGIRFQSALYFLPLGFEISFDFFPKKLAGNSWQISALGMVGF